MYAQITTDTSLDRTFDYSIPEHLAGRIVPGAKVKVSFGRRVIEGYVLSVSETTAHKGETKPILDVMHDRPMLTPAMTELAKWMAEYYIAPIETCLRTMLPAPVRRADADFKTRLYVEPTASEASTVCAEPPALSKRQAELLDIITRAGGAYLNAFCKQWKVAPATVKAMQAAGVVAISERAERRNPLEGRTILRDTPHTLTAEQQAAKDVVLNALKTGAVAESGKPVLLHGVTASGKTEVFLQSISAVLERGKTAIVLVPEISLTPQTIQRFAARFGDIIAVLHSRLGDGERHDEWHRIRAGEARVIIGPRSAVFAPVENLGIIIVDEEHEPSYKQDETPRYNARDVAVMRGRFERCVVLLGSATPSLESWHNARTGKYTLVSLTTRAVGQNMPHAAIVDMRPEFSQTGHAAVFSRPLIDAVKKRLALGEQTMLFLNRRGYAPTVICGKCGYTEKCGDCSVSMTYHAEDDILRCHMCGNYRRESDLCPECGASGYKHQGIGTQRVETIARKLFPGASIQRMDADVTAKKYSHEEILDRFRARKIDILIGTQMIVKGLDFPNVTLAGILNADMSLNVPDFRAGERTFQLIAQMAGRTGRGLVPGHVLVQTFSPEDPAIVCAQTENFAAFADYELAQREELNYPPFSRFICITFRGPDAIALERYAERFAKRIGDSEHFHVGAPCPAPLEKIKKNWRFQMTLRGTKIKLMSALIREALRTLPPPKDIFVAVDVDAMSTL